jgi:type IV secretory pathway TraG/TraD family ATPase VirD4
MSGYRFPFSSAGVGAGAASLGLVLSSYRPEIGVPLTMGGAAWTVGRPVLWYMRRNSTNALLARWEHTSNRNGGTASWINHEKVTSVRAMRRRAQQLKPSLAGLSRYELLRHPVTDYSYELARDGRRRVMTSVEDTVLFVGGPRTGKTGAIAGLIVDAPGAAIVTSTRTDLIKLTAPTRQHVGPIHVFNPTGLGRLASTVKWSPLAGCKVPSVAQTRAADMIPTANSPEAERWDVQARGALAMMLHAAAMADRPMSRVHQWISNPTEASAREVHNALRESPEAQAMQAACMQFFTTNDKTKTSITTTMMPAMRWLLDPRAAALADVVGGDPFDVRQFIADKGTMYLLGKEDGATAALVAAFTAEIARAAHALAADQASERLDPSLLIALDEAALVCPVPLDQWTADMGGRCIKIVISVQGRSQLRQRWGDEGAGTIMNNAASIVVYGAARDPSDLDAFSKLSGERREVVETRDKGGRVISSTHRAVPVLSTAQIANLPTGHAMLITRGMPACLVRTRMAWKRRDIKRAMKRSPWRPTIETAFETATELDEDTRDAGGEDA